MPGGVEEHAHVLLRLNWRRAGTHGDGKKTIFYDGLTWPRTNKVLLSGVTTLARLVARVRDGRAGRDDRRGATACAHCAEAASGHVGIPVVTGDPPGRRLPAERRTAARIPGSAAIWRMDSGGVGAYGGRGQGGVVHREVSTQGVDGAPDRVQYLGQLIGTELGEAAGGG